MESASPGEAPVAPPSGEPDEPGNVPWSIPIREADDGAHNSAGWFAGMPVGAALAAALAVVVFLIVVGLALVNDGPTDPAVLGEEVSSGDGELPAGQAAESQGSSFAGAGDADGSQVPSTTSTPTATSTTGPASTEPTVSSTSRAPESRAPEPGAGTSATASAAGGTSRPLDPDQVTRGWMAQLTSMPTDAGPQALSASYGAIAADSAGAVVFRSSEWGGLAPDYWIIADVGHATAADALDACEAAGRDGRNECFARYLTNSGSAAKVCYREDSGENSGECS